VTTEYVNRGYWLEAPNPETAARASAELRKTAAGLVGTAPAPIYREPGLGGARARVSQDKIGGYLDSLSAAAIRTPLSAEDHWRGLDLDDRALEKVTPLELTELLTEMSPELSIALWHFLRFANAGWEVKAARPGGAMLGSAMCGWVMRGEARTFTQRHHGGSIPSA
jgi:hypothetical protein